MNKRAETERLLRVVSMTAHRHSSDGWFCDSCNTDCGSLVADLCSCCQSVYESLAAAPDGVA